MKTYLLAALLALGLSPALAQDSLFGDAEAAIAAAETKAQQALDGTTVLANTQAAIERRVSDLEATVAAQATAMSDQAAQIAALEAAVTDLQDSPATWPAHGFFYVNAMPHGAGNTCDTTVTVPVECLPNMTDLEGDETDITVSCTSGSHDGTNYTPAEAGTHTCMFMASDPRWDHASHNSVVTINVTP